MKIHTDYLYVETPQRYEIRDITDDVARIVATSAVDDGMVLVSAMHITSSVFVNDHESGLWSDIMTWLEELAPANPSTNTIARVKTMRMRISNACCSGIK